MDGVEVWWKVAISYEPTAEVPCGGATGVHLSLP
jgi:hypothetical protein